MRRLALPCSILLLALAAASAPSRARADRACPPIRVWKPKPAEPPPARSQARTAFRGCRSLGGSFRSAYLCAERTSLGVRDFPDGISEAEERRELINLLCSCTIFRTLTDEWVPIAGSPVMARRFCDAFDEGEGTTLYLRQPKRIAWCKAPATFEWVCTELLADIASGAPLP